MQRLRLASRLWLAILPIALAALLAGAFVAWSFLQEADAHDQAAQSATVAEAAFDALRGVWVEAEAVDATTWGVDVDTGAARDIADDSLATLSRVAANLVAASSSDGQSVADSILATVADARTALADVRSQPVTETDPDRYQPVTSLILTIVPKTSFFIEDRVQARELTAAGALAEAARVTFGEEQIAAARPVLNFVTDVESEGDELFDDTSMAMLTAAEEEFSDWLTRAGAASPTAAAQISAVGISAAPMTDGLVDPEQVPVDRFEQVLAVAESLARQVAEESTTDAGTARTQAFVLIGITAAVLAIAGWAAFATSRTVVRRVRTVTEAARQIANVDLPNMVDALRNPQHQQFDAPSVVIPLEASHPDEVGELARSFGALHTTLIEVASQQMDILRKGVSDIFVTLARRNQALVDRQLALIDQLESSEEDPEILGGYYKLDHLATRMRRNAESLLVLAGTESPRVWGKPLAMGDVVRAALGEVDDYQRVDVLALEPARVSGGVVTDLAHLISELLDNAAQFSPPTERVRVTGLFERAGYLLTISDGGIGMSDGRLAELNRMLESPPVLGLALEPTLGMYVVARLAARHDVTVELVSGVPGTTARITIPRSLLEANEPRPVSSIDETPDREALPHTLRSPQADEPVPALNGGSSAPYAFRGVDEVEELPIEQPAENGHVTGVPHPLIAHASTIAEPTDTAPAPTDKKRRRPPQDTPTVDPSERVERAARAEAVTELDAADRPALPTRRKPVEAEAKTSTDAGTTTPGEAGSTLPRDTGSRTPAATGSTTPGDAGAATRRDAGPAATSRSHSPTKPERAETDRPKERPDGPSATPSGSRRKVGQHRAINRNERAPWERSDATEAGPLDAAKAPKPATTREPSPQSTVGTPRAAATPARDSAPEPAPNRPAGSPSNRSADDWWGPKDTAASSDTPASGSDLPADRAPGGQAEPPAEPTVEKLPLRSPGMTFKEGVGSDDSSSPSRFGASGIRAALTAYRSGRDSIDDDETPDGGEE